LPHQIFQGSVVSLFLAQRAFRLLLAVSASAGEHLSLDPLELAHPVAHDEADVVFLFFVYFRLNGLRLKRCHDCRIMLLILMGPQGNGI
jgi:hypothetical protein